MSGTRTARAPAPATALVETKLHVPRRGDGVVPRPELVGRLISGRRCKLTLICAPAGWGKTILLSEWHASPDEMRPFAWVSLDRADSDPVRFWSYAIGALRTIEPGVGAAALAALPMAGRDLVDAVIAPLINDLAASSQSLVLVLDDYHLVHSEPIHASMAMLLRHLPQNIQLAIATRADPPLPLPSLRAAGEIVEVRAAALSFSASEAEALLNGTLDLGLDDDDVELLHTRTEGWAAALRLAALTLQTHEDKGGFIRELAGDDRQIGDYLHDLLVEQPAPLRDFLRRTSILERMCAPLCDALTAADDAAERLEQIERSNLFLVPLDSHREWYRYHQLFRDLLRDELDPQLLPELHRRASAWHREHGTVDEAISHAMAAEDFAAAGELIAQHWRQFVIELGLVETAARWLDGLPRERVLGDPRLCLAGGWIAILDGRSDEVQEYLVAAESCPQAPGPLYAITSSLESALTQLRTTYAFLCGDVARAIDAARRALDLERDEESLARAVANINLGEAFYFAGKVEEADRVLTAGLRILEMTGRRNEAVIAGLAQRAAIHADAGRMLEAERRATEAEALIEIPRREDDASAVPASEVPLLWTRGMSPRLLHVRGQLLEHGGDLPAAETAFARAAMLARRAGRRLDLAQALISLARLKRRQRQQAAARAFAREARQVLDSCPDSGFLAGLLRRTERGLQLQTSRPVETVLPADLDLSDRELTVLRLLASELSQREIGSELYVSFNTVKAHTRSIFRKLGVATRAGAVARGRELGLI